MSEVPVFRATKRRKTAAKSIHQPTTNKNSSSGSEDNQPAGPLVRPRGQVKVKSRVGGITFTNTRSLEIGAADDESTAMIVRGTATNSASKEANTKTNGLANRFIGSGMGAGIGRDTIENDENVMAYIDAEMARRRQNEVSVWQTRTPRPPPREVTPGDAQHGECTIPLGRAPRSSEDPTDRDDNDDDDDDDDDDEKTNHFDVEYPFPNSSNLTHSTNIDPKSTDMLPREQHHPSHQLIEIDLSTQDFQIPDAGPKIARKKRPRVRLGRDGKPFRPRPRKTRDEEDVAREALVEQFLQDNGGVHGLYDSGLRNAVGVSGATIGSDGLGVRITGENARSRGDDEDADERMEREFRREFMDRAVERAQTSGSGSRGKNSKGSGDGLQGSGQQGAGSGSVLSSGPRLGGSRSARARMVAALEKEREKEREQGK